MTAYSIKARLKNYALKNGISFQEALTYFGLERTIYRISVSKYADHFVLKGGIFLYAVFQRNYSRATADIDLLARKISNRAEEMKEVFANILSIDADDALVYDTGSISVVNITEFKEYHGLHISALYYLDKTRVPISIDIGFGDIVFPDAVQMAFPVILNMRSPIVYAYSLESSLAEKLEAIIRNGYLNSRYKDFYDIYALSENHTFMYNDLKQAIEETFKNRKTALSLESSVFGQDFINDTIHQSRWKAFIKNKKVSAPVSLSEVMERIVKFITPLIKGPSFQFWDPEQGNWHST